MFGFSEEKFTMPGLGEGRVLTPRDASILSLIARLAPNKTRQVDMFARLNATLESKLSREIAGLLVGAIEPDSASDDAKSGASAMQEWVNTKIKSSRSRTNRTARLGLSPRLSLRKRAR